MNGPSPTTTTAIGWVGERTPAVERAIETAAGQAESVQLDAVDVARIRRDGIDVLVVPRSVATDALDRLETAVLAGVSVLVYGAQGAGLEQLYRIGIAEIVPVELTPETASLITDRADCLADRPVGHDDDHWSAAFCAAMPVGVAVLDSSGAVEVCNDRYAASLDSTPEELHGRSVADLHGEAATAPFDEVAAARVASWTGQLPPLDLPSLPPDGTRVDGEYYSLFRLADRVVALRHTLPDRDRPVSVAVEESQMLRALFGEAPVSVYFKDERCRHVRVSENSARMHTGEPVVTPTGDVLVEPRDFCGLTDQEIYGELLWTESMVDDRLVVQGGESIMDKEERSVHGNGEVGWARTSKVPWRDEDGEIIGLLGVTIDVTESKRNELAIRDQRDRLDEFTAIISHDLRNPLAVATSWLGEVEGNEDAVVRISDALERIDSIVTDLLTLARDGKTVAEFVDVDVEMLARRAWSTVETADATLVVTDSVQVPGDSDRLCHLFENLYRNSIDHGRDDVTVTVGALDDRTGFFVEDDGPGIDENDRESVRTPGYTTSSEGTGFGLSIVSRLAEAHGWLVTLAQSPDCGVRFEFAAESSA